MPDRLPIRRALLSVSDKTGLVALGQALVAHGAELISTGGTAAALARALPVTEVATHTGFPEMLDGRVKTLVPQLHGGLLARRDDPSHMGALAAHGILPIDLVCVNLYPFKATVARGASAAEILEQVDIGGPALLRSAAKNHSHVAVLSDPSQYPAVIAGLAEGGTVAAERAELAAAAFARTAAYDAAIAAWFAGAEAWPERLTLAATRREVLRYGENPHQEAAFYALGQPGPGVASAVQVQGKPLSYNNLADLDAAYECVAEFEAPAAVIVKHANPCGAAVGATLAEAWASALASDPTAAFGGIVALNRTLDAATARAVAEIFTECVIAPAGTDEARAVFARKPNLRLLLAGGVPDPAAPGRTIRSVAGGLLLQSRDTRQPEESWRVATARAPDEAEMADLRFAWRVARHVRSNAIVLARGGATVGVGAGQMSRVDAARLAVAKAGERARGAAVASDAFFPFADGLQAAIDAGATAAIQPGGSVRDAEVVAAADAAGMAMVFTGQRHFRH